MKALHSHISQAVTGDRAARKLAKRSSRAAAEAPLRHLGSSHARLAGSLKQRCQRQTVCIGLRQVYPSCARPWRVCLLMRGVTRLSSFASSLLLAFLRYGPREPSLSTPTRDPSSSASLAADSCTLHDRALLKHARRVLPTVEYWPGCLIMIALRHYNTTEPTLNFREDAARVLQQDLVR